jgi:hypothetical protein
MATLSPGLTCVTEDPTDSTVPDASWPMTRGLVSETLFPLTPPWFQKWT